MDFPVPRKSFPHTDSAIDSRGKLLFQRREQSIFLITESLVKRTSKRIFMYYLTPNSCAADASSRNRFQSGWVFKIEAGTVGLTEEVMVL